MFPDGQLYTKLRGAEATVDPAAVLTGFLREMGIAGSDIPEGLDDRARMFRAQLSARRVLVLLDDAAGAEQILPLLPGSRGCAVLVTSRPGLSVLPGAHVMTLRVMQPDEGVGMLAGIIGADRARAEPESVVEVARLCGYLPLALRIAGARLASRPAWRVSRLGARLGEESRRLDLLKAGDLEVRASFALSYSARSETERRAFRLLGLIPVDFPAWNLATLLGTDVDGAEDLLERLVDAGLVGVAGVDTTGRSRARV